MMEKEKIEGIRNMFRACLIRLVKDALTSKVKKYVKPSSNNINNIDIDLARKYLMGLTNESDLREICSYANISADRVIKKSRELFSDGREDFRKEKKEFSKLIRK